MDELKKIFLIPETKGKLNFFRFCLKVTSLFPQSFLTEREQDVFETI